jgi:PAS domain S-box-containing protein
MSLSLNKDQSTIIAVLITIVIFIIDFFSPLWYEAWLLYLIPLFFMYQSAKRPYLLSVIIMMLTAARLLVSSSDSALLMHAAANRITGICGGWGVSVLLMQFKRLNMSLMLARNDLEKRVADRTAALSQSNLSLEKEIRDRLRAEDILLKSERRLSRAEEVAGSGNWEIHLDDNIVYASNGAKIIFGLEGRKWNLADVQKIPLTAYRVKLDEALKGLIEHGRPYNVEFKIRRLTNGKTIDVHSIAEYDPAKRIVFGVIQDITAHKRAEKALRVAEKTFRDLLETIQLVAIMLDCEGNIKFCNDYLLHLADWKKEEVLGRNWFDLFISHKEREEIRKVFASVINGETYHLHYENSIVARNGRELIISWNNTVLHDLEGNVTGTASIGIDITENKSLEAQLRQAQKMEAVGILAGGIAHDFNNILTAIMGYGHLVRNNLNDNDPMVANVDQILESADRGAQLTRSLLAFGRKQVLNPKPVDLNEIIKRFEAMVSRLIGEHIEVRTVLSNTEIIINADAVQIEQVLMNMATNAKDAMPNGGYFTIRTQLVEPDEAFAREHPDADLGMYALISVSDTGVGMAKESLENIFDPFFTTKELGRGTGLGLAMVYGIIDQHNGYISVTSELGKGTIFNIYLPICKPKVEISVIETDQPPVIGGSETLLVAEDDDKLRELTEIVLKRYGYQVILAENGEDAISKFITHRDTIQLIILDMLMPKKSGKDAYDEIKKIRPGIKTIFASGYTADKMATDEMLDQRLTFIKKPWSPKHLLMKVREVLNNSLKED